jgi:hypothetical protein
MKCHNRFIIINIKMVRGTGSQFERYFKVLLTENYCFYYYIVNVSLIPKNGIINE